MIGDVLPGEEREHKTNKHTAMEFYQKDGTDIIQLSDLKSSCVTLVL